MSLLHLGLTAELLGCRKDIALILTYLTALTEFIKQWNEMWELWFNDGFWEPNHL